MTRLLDRAFEAARTATPETQDELARVLLSFLGDAGQPEFELTAEDEEAVSRSREAFAQGQVATDQEMRALSAKHGL